MKSLGLLFLDLLHKSASLAGLVYKKVRNREQKQVNLTFFGALASML